MLMLVHNNKENSIMTMPQTWYDDTSASRCIIAKVSVYSTGSAESIGEKVKYFSNRGYNTATADILIDPCMTGTVRFSESISSDGDIAISYGDLELDNTDGSKDVWLDVASYVWVNRSIQVYYGDPTQILANATAIASTFDLIFDGIIVDIGSRSRNTVNIKVRDKMERLNVPITETTLGTYGTWGAGVGQTNQDTVLPLIFGEPHNVQPLLIDPALLEYQINNGEIEQITEIRDNGVPIHDGVASTSSVTLTFDTLGTSGANTSTLGGGGSFAIGSSFNTETGCTFGSSFVIYRSDIITPSTSGTGCLGPSISFSGDSASTINIDPARAYTGITLDFAAGTDAANITVHYETASASSFDILPGFDWSMQTGQVLSVVGDIITSIVITAPYGMIIDNLILTGTGSSGLVGATVDLSTGKFKLSKPIVGDCTVSVQGIKKSINLNTGALVNSYNNNIASILATIVTQYGPSNSRLAASDIDLPNFLTFSTENTQPVGLAILDRQNILSICRDLTNSVGAQLYFTRQGKLQLITYGEFSSGSVVTITNKEIVHNTLSISNRSSIIAAKKIGYCKNWFVQNNLITAIPVQHKYWFSENYWLKTSEDTTNTKTLYKLNLEPVQKDTLLVRGSDAIAEATRLNNYFGVIRTTYRFTGTSKLLTLKLGQQVILQNNRFGLTSGKSGQVVTLEPNWTTGLIDVEVVI
jgi:hypothetical protein